VVVGVGAAFKPADERAAMDVKAHQPEDRQEFEPQPRLTEPGRGDGEHQHRPQRGQSRVERGEPIKFAFHGQKALIRLGFRDLGVIHKQAR